MYSVFLFLNSSKRWNDKIGNWKKQIFLKDKNGGKKYIK